MADEVEVREYLESLEGKTMVEIGDVAGGYIVTAEFALLLFNEMIIPNLENPDFKVSAWGNQLQLNQK